MGQQHAEQLRSHISQGMIRFYRAFWKRMLEQKRNGAAERFLNGTVRFVLEPWLVRRLQTQIPDYGRDRIRGMANVMGESVEELSRILVLPDLLPILGALVCKLRPQSFIDVSPPPRFGCTSFISSGNRFLHGRNLDFPGVAYWDRFPVVQVTAPSRGLRYIGMTTAGVPLCGITGVNEAQISISLHQHYCRTAALGGTLPFVIAERILSEARNLAAAQEILRSARVASSWAFLVTDGKDRTAFVYEAHPKAGGMRTLTSRDNVLVQSNYYQSTECKRAEYATSARMNWDNHYRKYRLETLVRNAGEGISPEQAVQFMSDGVDAFWNEEKIVNRTVSITYNVQSMVLDPERMVVYLAEGDAPVQMGRYIEMDLGRLLNGGTEGTGSFLRGFKYQNPAKEKAKKDFVLSLVAAFDGDWETALMRASGSLQHDFCPEVAQVVAVLYLKGGEFKLALDYLKKACALIEEKVQKQSCLFPPEYFELCLFRARTLDLLGRRSEALNTYRAVASHPHLEDGHIRKIAERAGPYSARLLNRILMPFSSYVPFE